MSGRIASHLRGNAVGYVAVFIALSGTAAALPGRNTVDTGDIKNGQVKTKDVADGGLTGVDIDEPSLDATVLQRRVENCAPNSSIQAVDESGAVTCDADDSGGPPSGPAGGDLAGTYPNPTIAPDAVGTNEVDSSLAGSDIADSNSLGTAEINEGDLYNDNSLNDADIDQASMGLRSEFGFTALSAGGFQQFETAAGRYAVSYLCPSALTDLGEISFSNQSGAPMRVFWDNGGTNPGFFPSLPAGASLGFGATPSGERYVFTYQAATNPVRFATVTVDSAHDATSCYAQSQGWLSG